MAGVLHRAGSEDATLRQAAQKVASFFALEPLPARAGFVAAGGGDETREERVASVGSNTLIGLATGAMPAECRIAAPKSEGRDCGTTHRGGLRAC